MFFSTIKHFISTYHLFTEDERLVVCVSGGVDSIVLTDVLSRLIPLQQLLVAHCNFHLRGAESNRDETFVRDFCRDKDLPLIVQDFDTLHYCKEHKLSVEMGARELRYRWFEELRTERQYDKIVVAHHANDQAETVLLNLFRGTGIRGLGGMKPVNGNIIRPLLCVTRHDILTYAQQRHLSFVEDSTNTDTRFQRNKIRSLLQAFGDTEIRHIANTALSIQSYLPTLHPQIGSETALYEQLKDTFSPKMIQNIYQEFQQGDIGKRFLGKEFMAEIRKEGVSISPRVYKEPTPHLTTSLRPKNENEIFPPAEAKTVFIDADKVHGQLSLRHWQTGDVFYPIGLQGRKRKVGDIFTDRHLSQVQRSQQWLCCDESGEIIWLVGYRLSEHYKITPNTTQICVITVS